MNEITNVEAATVERVQTGNELERCPHPIPFGWFCVMLSDELALKEVKIFHVFGRDWVLFRGEDGKVARIVWASQLLIEQRPLQEQMARVLRAHAHAAVQLHGFLRD